MSDYESKRMEIMRQAGEVLGDRTPISTFGDLDDATLEAWAADEDFPGRAATAAAVLRKRREAAIGILIRCGDPQQEWPS
jgi:hypothetical protein